MARWKADAHFIAHARTDVPALCDEVERLRAAVISWQGKLAEACHNQPGKCFCGSHIGDLMAANVELTALAKGKP